MPQLAAKLLRTSLSQKILLALAFGYLLSCLFLWAGNLWDYYSRTDGFWLPNGRMAGGDFLAFYTGAKFALSRTAELYDLGAQLEFQREFYLAGSGRDPEGALVFVYPPQVAFILQPLAELSLVNGFYAFSGIGLLAVITSSFLLLRQLGMSGLKLLAGIVSILGFVPLTFECLAGGQLSWLGFAIVIFAYLSLQKNKQLMAGIVISLGAYKPPLFALIWLVLFVSQSGRFRLGFVLGGLAQLFIAIHIVGVSGLLQYLGVAINYRYGAEPAPGVALPSGRGTGLYAFLARNYQAGAGMVVLLVIMLLLACWLIASIKREGLTTRNFILTSAFSLYLSPQFLIYDLSIAVPLVLLSLSTASPIVIVSSVLLYLEWLVRSGLQVEQGALVSMMAYSIWLISLVSGDARRT